jgi:hypothetical protein
MRRMTTRMGIPSVVCGRAVSESGRATRVAAHINAQIQQVERTRIALLARLAEIELAGGEHGEQQVGEMEHGRAKDLLGDVKGPDQDRSLRPFAPAFVDQRQQGQRAQGGLDEQREGAQELTLTVVRRVGRVHRVEGDRCSTPTIGR